MDIQVWSDVTCPWCYIGRRRLEKALESFSEAATVTYRAYQLDTSLVPAALPLKEVMAAGVGGPERVEEMVTQVTTIGVSEGLTLDFDRAIAANTLLAHRLIGLATTHDRQTDMLDALQRAHFAEGVDIGALPALVTVAESIGLPAAEALAYLESEAGTGAVHADIAEARALGISSVPTFVIDGKYALSGAQEPATLLSALEEIVRREDANAGR